MQASGRDRLFLEIKKKKAEILELEWKIRDAKTYIQALEEAVIMNQENETSLQEPSK